MFVFVFDGSLFKLSENTPAFVPLFQLPPRSAAPPEPSKLVISNLITPAYTKSAHEANEIFICAM